MRIKVEINLDSYEWDGRTLQIQLIAPDYIENEEPDPEENIIEETGKPLKVIGKSKQK